MDATKQVSQVGSLAGHTVGCLRQHAVLVWCLRIVEWVRASLWSSYVGHMVDVWALGADEGRGRLR